MTRHALPPRRQLNSSRTPRHARRCLLRQSLHISEHRLRTQLKFLKHYTPPISLRIMTTGTAVSDPQYHKPAAVQKSALHPSIQLSCSVSEYTAMSFVAACLTSVIAARARDAREMYSRSILNFGAELGRLPMCLLFNISHNIIKRFPSRCQVDGIDCATDLLDRELLVTLLLLQPKILRFHVLHVFVFLTH